MTPTVIPPCSAGATPLSPTGSPITYNGEIASLCWAGHFARLIPDRQVVEVIEFETTDPALGGTMTLTTTLTDADGGTDILVVHDGILASVPPADNETGTRMALANLAALVEADTRQ